MSVVSNGPVIIWAVGVDDDRDDREDGSVWGLVISLSVDFLWQKRS